MQSKLLLIIGISSLLTQCIESLPAQHGLRVARSSAAEENAENLLVTASVDFGEIAKNVVLRGKDIFEKVVKEFDSSSNKSATLQNKLNEFTEFNTRAEKLSENISDPDTITEIFELFSVYTTLEDKYDLEDKENVTAEDRTIAEKLEKDNIDQNNVLFFLEFQIFQRKFERQVQRYINTLRAEEKQKNEQLMNWFTKYKSEQDIEKKIDLFFVFVDLFDDE